MSSTEHEVTSCAFLLTICCKVGDSTDLLQVVPTPRVVVASIVSPLQTLTTSCDNIVTTWQGNSIFHSFLISLLYLRTIISCWQDVIFFTWVPKVSNVYWLPVFLIIKVYKWPITHQEIRHMYAGIGVYHVRINCTNRLYSAKASTISIVQVPISGTVYMIAL